MQKTLFYLLSLVVLCCLRVGGAVAQPRTGPMSGHVYEVRDEGLRQQRVGLVGAVVEVITAVDTLYTTSDLNGNFHLRQVAAGKARVKVSYLGYNSFEQDSVHIAPRYGLARPLRIQLSPQSQQIDEVVVKGRAQLSTQRGDTLIFNAAAVRTMAGDEVVHILEQMPGVEVSEDGSVAVLGEQIARVYVNGRALFGEDPKVALTSLMASEVTNVEVYDEDTDEDRNARRRFAEKQRVMNVRTKRNIASLIDGFFLASGGMDFDRNEAGRRQYRYGVGATMNLFSEKLRLTFDGHTNNIGRSSNRLRDVLRNNISTGSYKEQHSVYVALSKLWGKSRREGQLIDLSYSYSDHYTRSSSITHRSYFATDASPARHYADTLSQGSTGGTHTVKLYGLVHLGGRHQISSRNEFSYSTPASRSSRRSVNTSESLTQRSEVLERNASHGYTLKNNLNWLWNNPRVVRPYISLNSTIGRNERAGWRIDTLTNEKRVLESDYVGPHASYSAEFSLQRDIYETDGMRMELFASYQLDYEESRMRQIALNSYAPVVEIDPTNTYNYTYRYLTHSGRVAYRINSSLYRLNLICDLRSARLKKDELLPEETAYRERFFSVLPSVEFTLVRHGRRINIFRYTTLASLPSVEQLRDRIDNSNPLLLQSGNPDLKQSIGHSFALSYPGNVNADNGRNVVVEAAANFTTDQITQRSYYFEQDTHLERWNYTAPAGSTLYTYENVDGAYSLSGTLRFSQRIAPLRSTLQLSARYQFNNRPAFIGAERNTSRQHQPSFSVSLGGTQATGVRLAVRATTSYSDVENTIGEDIRYIYQTAGGSAELKLFGRLMFNVNYSLAYCHYLTDSGRDTNTQMLNVLIGLELIKGRMQLSAAAYDLLKRGSSFATATYADYELQQWQPSYGRYFTINLGFRLNKNNPKGYRGAGDRR